MTCLSEKALQNACIRWLRKEGIFYWKFQDKFSAGFPDLMLANNGYTLFVELKRKGGKPTALQQAVHQKMEKAGLVVLVIDNFDEFKSLVKQWLAATNGEEELWN